MGVKYSDLSKYTKLLEKKLSKTERETFFRKATNRVAGELTAAIVRETPVGVYPSGSGRVGGTLRRGWVMGQVTQDGTGYKSEIKNDVEYSPYVEYGHRTRGGNGWVEGQFFMTNTVESFRPRVPEIVKQMVERELEGL